MRRLAKIAMCLAGLSFVACDRGKPPAIEELEPPPPGLKVEPKWLTFTCLEPGCDVSLQAKISVVGVRNVAVKRIVLSEDDRTDFIVEPSREPPFVLEAGETFSMVATHRPSGDARLSDLSVKITYGDASADEEENRIEPGEIVIPLVRRLIGEPKMVVSPDNLNFGPVAVGTEGSLPISVKNDGFGNVGLIISSFDSSHPDVVRVEELPPQALLPGEEHQVSAVFAPIDEEYVSGELTVTAVDRSIEPVVVPFEATSIQAGRLVTVPDERVDFGNVPISTMATVPVEVANIGSEPVDVVSLGFLPEPSVGTATVVAEDGRDLDVTLGPLERRVYLVGLTTEFAGPIDGTLRITRGAARRDVLVPLTGLVTKPEVQVTPASIDFGAIPRGWTVTENVEVKNAGFGELVISNVSLLLGSSELFTLRTIPNLPIILQNEERVAFELEFRSEAEASFSATLSVDSNDPDSAFVEVPLGATGASCDLGCPIVNGTPSCTGGVCSIGACDADWYDADLDPATGCECAEIGRDPGSFCSQGRFIGTLKDTDGDRATFSGILPEEDDIDFISFFADDRTNIFGDDFDVRVSLESSDPGIQFCIYRHNTGDHTTECFLENESCPSNRSYRRDGSQGPNDSADFVIKIFRDPNVAPTCTSYTVFMRNG